MREADDERVVTTALKAVADRDADLDVSQEVETRLLAHVRSIGRARRQRMYLAGCAVAAASFLAVWVPLRRIPTDSRPVQAIPKGYPTTASPREAVTDFLALTYDSVPVVGAQVVRLEVPRAALANFGLGSLAFHDHPSDRIWADVLVGEDGLARAVRFVLPAPH